MGKVFEWDRQKNKKLIQDRGVSFEAVVALIEEDNILGVIPGAGKYGHQKQFVLVIHEYVYFVPFIESEHSIFLKTIVPSRKLTKRYLSGGCNMKKYSLDKEEREILKAVESGRWPISRLTKAERERYALIARNTLKKDQRMNIRISKADLTGIKGRAAEEGVPYQTLVSSLIHKYVSGTLAAA